MLLPQTLQLNLIVNHRKVSQAETNHHKMSVALAHFDAEYMLYIAVVKKKKKNLVDFLISSMLVMV